MEVTPPSIVMVVAQFRSRVDCNIPETMAGLALASWAAILAYVVGQRYFVHGLPAGSVRG